MKRSLFLVIALVLGLVGVGVYAQGPGPVPFFLTCGSGLTCSPTNPMPPSGGTIAATAGVTSVGSGACLTGGPITTSGTLSGAAGVDARTTTSEAVNNGDQCKLVTFNNSGAVAATIPQAGAGGLFNSFWSSNLLNLGSGTVTLTPATSTINGASSLTLLQNQGCAIYSDGANYAAECGLAPVSPVFLGTLVGNGIAGSVTFGSLPAYNSFEVHINAINVAGSGQPLLLRLNGDSGSNYAYTGLIQGSTQSLPQAFNTSADSSITMMTNVDPQNPVSGWIKISGAVGTAPGGPYVGPAISWAVDAGHTGDRNQWVRDAGTGGYSTNSNISSIQILLNQMTGRVSLWGYPNE